MWEILIFEGAKLGISLVTDLLAMRDKERAGTPLTPDDWMLLGSKWTSASNEQKAREAIARAGLK